MRNRAKCKVCGDLIESFHASDHVTCSCGEIDVFAGQAMRCAAKSFKNFIRIDDQDNEIPVIEKPVDDPVSTLIYQESGLSKKELYEELKELVKRYDSLPRHVLDSPVSHADLLGVLLVLSELLRLE